MELILEPRARSFSEIAGDTFHQHTLLFMFLLAERHDEPLLDICQDTNSSPTDMITVTKKQNIILQSISSSEVRSSL